MGAQTPAGDGAKCPECDTVCPNEAGLGQHIRHRHPKRIAAVRADVERKRKERKEKPPKTLTNLIAIAKAKGKWSDEEIALLLELETKHANVRCINKAIASELHQSPVNGLQCLMTSARRYLKTLYVWGPER